MRTATAILASILATACMGGSPPEPSPRALAELDDALQGRVAQPPRHCVSQRDLGGNRSIGEQAILFGGRTNRIVYVNRPPGGCPDISGGRALRVRTTSSQLCAGDIVEVFDTANNISFGSCGLGDFTPYKKVR
jgi:hypothetical protein